MDSPTRRALVKSKGVPATGAQLAGGDQAFVDRRVLVGEQVQRVIQDRRRCAGRQVEVRSGW